MDYKFSDRVLALKPNLIREMLKKSSDPEVIALSAGNPSPDAFPIDEISSISDSLLNDRPVDVLQYGISEGYEPLRNTIKKYLKETHNNITEDDELIIVSGAQQVMDLAAKTFVNEHETIICESPSFIGSINTFRSYNANIVGVPLEEDGMNIELLEKALQENPNTKLIYVITNFQNPSGCTTSFEKRKEIYRLAQKYDAMIIEDNPYGDLRYFGENIPDIKTLDTDGRVIYAGSFSKVIAPGIRVAYLLANKEAMSKMLICKQGQDVHTCLWSQMLCNEYMTKFDFEKHLEKTRNLYRRKATLCMDLLDKYVVPNGITYNKIDGGLFIWCTLPENVDMPSFVKELLNRKVCVVSGKAFLTDPDLETQSFRINFSMPSDEAMTKAIKIIGELAKETIGEKNEL